MHVAYCLIHIADVHVWTGVYANMCVSVLFFTLHIRPPLAVWCEWHHDEIRVLGCFPLVIPHRRCIQGALVSFPAFLLFQPISKYLAPACNWIPFQPGIQFTLFNSYQPTWSERNDIIDFFSSAYKYTYKLHILLCCWVSAPLQILPRKHLIRRIKSGNIMAGWDRKLRP